jgi:hypothetical protein
MIHELFMPLGMFIRNQRNKFADWAHANYHRCETTKITFYTPVQVPSEGESPYLHYALSTDFMKDDVAISDSPPFQAKPNIR